MLGPTRLLTDPDQTLRHRADWTGRWVGPPVPVALPDGPAEVAAVLAACAQHGVGVVPQGGNTGLAAGAVPGEGQLVLSLQRLRSLEDQGDQLVAGAGTTVAEVQARAAARGRAYAVDLASRDSATIGGTVATNAGGLRVLRHGGTRAQLTGIEAVLANGAVLSTIHAPERDNTGYDVAGLLCGSEGTLGIVTAARLRLVPRAESVTVALLGFTTEYAAAAAAPLLRLPAVAAVELMLSDGISLVRDAAGLPEPLAARAAAYLLVEAAELPATVEDLPGLVDAAVATDATARARLWAYRERHPDAVTTLGVPHKLDVAVPVERLGDLIALVRARVGELRPAARLTLFGHAAEGNLHVNITGVAPDDEAVDDAVLAAVVELGGSVSAEHGIGRLKRRWLPASRGAASVEAMRAVKAALDPAGILNPGALFP